MVEPLVGGDACTHRSLYRSENGSDKLWGAERTPASGCLPAFQAVSEERHRLPYDNTPIVERHTPFLGSFLDGQEYELLHGVAGRVVRLPPL